MVYGILLAASVGFIVPANANNNPDPKKFPSLLSSPSDAPVIRRAADSLYNIIGLGMYGLEREVFFSAYKGLQYLDNQDKLKKPNLLTICDYSQSSNNKRLYVIDVVNARLLYNTYVSHGKNSGHEFATRFSNIANSNQSSLGFMVTAETYNGKAGYSMRFDGMERGINDKVRMRDIVFHGSRFVNENTMIDRGLIGNSLGCPAVPYGIHTRIINEIKGGSCFYIHSADQLYARTSSVLNARFDLEPEALAMQQNLPLQAEGNQLPVIQTGATLTHK
ncbi:murein L,D-transpeptidase catalytic domain family protein [Aridibaculum aurantiacum]|uniref:murein L,D-transpeptidase catalytic domain family protein n=1 Tax=Aridibaculum aurantiacum TaxID=2810307 RepID=UPI001A96DEBD|nr:murein L,D-transpeptidase catalytic domain family protein [Aridibaculum aurantiacum]